MRTIHIANAMGIFAILILLSYVAAIIHTSTSETDMSDGTYSPDTIQRSV